MAGTGRVQVISKTPVSHNQYDVMDICGIVYQDIEEA